MSEKPTPAPWEIAPEGTYPVEEGHKILGPWRKTKAGRDIRSYVAQFMTKADAELIVRAQHLDELVEAARDALLTLERAGCEPFRNGVSDQNGQGDEGEYWYGCSVDNLRNALFKIEGKQ